MRKIFFNIDMWTSNNNFVYYVLSRDEEVEHGMALMPQKSDKENAELEEEYDPHKHRNVPHPTS